MGGKLLTHTEAFWIGNSEEGEAKDEAATDKETKKD